MRNFILGLVAGGLAGYLWQTRRMRRQIPSSRLPDPNGFPSTGGKTQAVEPLPSPDATRPAATTISAGRAPSYQAAPLAEYAAQYQALAEDLFAKTIALVGKQAGEKQPDRYRFLEKSGTAAAKIVIYQRNRGQEAGAFPMLQDGVYLLLRTHRSAPNTLTLAPNLYERFHYRRVDLMDLDDAAQQVADLLQAV
jgi:hypothetical protein